MQTIRPATLCAALLAFSACAPQNAAQDTAPNTAQDTPRLVQRARTETRRVAAGRPSVLYTFVHFRRSSCEPAPDFVVTVVSPPAHGRIATGPGSVVPHQHTSLEHLNCRDLVPGVEVRYTPEPGYRGPDTAVVSDGDSRVTFAIEVRPPAVRTNGAE